MATIHRALDLGVTFLDTADMYGPFLNEELVGRAIAGRRDEVVLATKFGIVRDRTTRRSGPSGATPPTSGRPATRRCAGWASTTSTSTTSTGATPACPSRRRSGPWPSWWPRARSATSGLSEAAPDTLRRACAVHPIAALQSEWSLWSRDIEAEVVADGPRARHRHRGLQPARSGLPHRPDHLARRLPGRATSGATSPGSPGENFARNLELVERGAGAGRRRRDVRPASWPWPGCWPGATTWCPSPAPSAGPTSRRTWRALDVELEPRGPGRHRRGLPGRRGCRRPLSGHERRSGSPRPAADGPECWGPTREAAQIGAYRYG